jgi:hypothetical protein
VTEEAGEPTALQELILEAKRGEDDISYARLAARAGRRPDGRPWMLPGQIQKYATLTLEDPPRPAAITGLARALRRPERVVRAAIGETFGFRDPLPEEVRGLSYAHGLAERADALDDPVVRQKVLWAWEHLLRSVEPALDVAVPETVGEVGEALLDAVRAMSDTQRRKARAVLDEVLGEGDEVPENTNGPAPA